MVRRRERGRRERDIGSGVVGCLFEGSKPEEREEEEEAECGFVKPGHESSSWCAWLLRKRRRRRESGRGSEIWYSSELTMVLRDK